MVSKSIQRLLRQIGRDHFYLMHASYGRRASRQGLWDFAKQNSLIGLDFGGIDQRWDQVSNVKRSSLTRIWQHQFELFSSIEDGECVLVANGQTDLLGVGLAKEPYKFEGKLGDNFFRHVRRVKWLVAYDWNRRMPVGNSLVGFRNTTLRVGEESPFWRLASLNIGIKTRPPRKIREKGMQRNQELERKYGPRGEGDEHKELKHRVLDHPEIIVHEPVLKRHEEYRFESGDRADIVFDLARKRHCVVEIETDLPMPGAHQALKYRTLKCAELGLDVASSRVEAVLVAWKDPDNRFCKRYGIRFVKLSH